jgi:Spy/CpxP family protein refolding chaperone
MATSTLPQPRERTAILSLALVFLCGMVAGALVMSLWIHPGIHAGAKPAGSVSVSLNTWQRELDLSEDQARQLKSILDDFAHYYDNLLADGNSRVMQILNPEQRKRFDRMLRDRRQSMVPAQ